MTAQYINNSNQSNFTGSESIKRSSWSKIATIISIIAGIVAILAYFGLNPNGGEMAEKDNIFISSENQSGGITAHTVNVGSQARTLTPQLASQLEMELSKHEGKKIIVTAVMGDQEAFQFANQILEHLRANGIIADGVNQAVYTSPVTGQRINHDDDKVDIIIGSRGN